jgi:hypothetical protein
MPHSLRPSQIKALEIVGEWEDDGATPLRVSVHLGRGELSTEWSLIRLMELGYLERSSVPLCSSVYSLTPKGREALKR